MSDSDRISALLEPGGSSLIRGGNPQYSQTRALVYRPLALPFERFVDQSLAHATVYTTGSQSSIDDYSRDATDAIVFGPRCGFVGSVANGHTGPW